MSEVISGLVIDGKYTLSSGVVLVSAVVQPGGVLSALAGGTATDLTVEDGASLHMAVAPDTLVEGTSAGVAFSNSNGYLSGYTHEPTSTARIAISSGGTAVDITCLESWINVSQGGLLSNSYITSYGRLGLNGGDAIDVTVEAGAQFFVTVAEGTNLDITSGGKKIVAVNGVIDGVTADGQSSAWYYITSGGSAINTTGNNKMWLAVSAGYASNTILRASGNPTGTNRARLDLRSAGVTEKTYISAGGSMSVANDRSVASRTYIYEGGVLDLVSTAKAEGDEAHLYAKDTYVFSGGTMLIKQNTVVTGELQIEDGAKVTLTGSAATLDFDVTNRATTDAALYNNYSFVTGAANARHTVTVSTDQADGIYALADGAASFAATVTVKTATDTLGTLKVGDALVTDDTGYVLLLNGEALTFAAAEIREAATAGALTADGTLFANDDRAARWTAATGYAGNVRLAEGMTSGNAWLNIDGFADGAANLYGTAQDQAFAGSVNIKALAGTVKNIAGGAGLGGKVGGVKLTVENGMTVTGAVYAGGMGDVTGKTETLIEGGAFNGNLFAGALCNYVADNKATSTGDVNLTVDGGTFKGSIYAGAAVKAGTATTVVHTAEEITVTLNGGSAPKQAFCVYGGGYATGTTEDASVYTAGDVDIAIAGGSWGSYLSGRGIFGGVYADKVAASVEDVTISVTGGKMGNVYGGGWAQNGGTSTVVGEVNITIAGDANVANVFGGGSYSSTSGGATSVGSVTIRVSGGDIANNIFAAGQNEFSSVTGDVSVTFTGANDYSCNVYGYGVQSSATNTGDKTLAFDGFTGTLSGAIGGFDTIGFTGNTATTLNGAEIDNGAWSFDYTDRTLDAATAMLSLNDGTISGDTVLVDLSTAAPAASGWSIATGLASADATFGVNLSTGSAADLGLGDALGSAYGIYEGWGFTLEDSTLKFKQLA